MALQYFLGVDLGAESGRVIAGQFDGKRISLNPLHRFPNGPVNLGSTLRWNVLGLWSEIQNGLRLAASECGKDIASVGVDTWGVDYVLLTKNEEIVGQPYHYRDSRNEGVMQGAFSTVPRSEIYAQTGLQFMEFNTLYQLLAFKQAEPGLLKEAAHFLMMPDFLHFCMSGSKVVEFTNATTTQCLHATRKNWADNLLTRFGLPTEIFPQVVQPGTRLGKLRESVANSTGLSRIEVIAPATHDTGAAVAAVPTRHTGKANWAYISSGTWSLMGLELPEAILTEAALAQNVTNEGGVDGTYRLLKNIMGLWLIQECKRSFERKGNSLGYGSLMNLARDAKPFRSLVNPDDHRFLKPTDMVTEIRNSCKETSQPVPETEGEFIRCAMESLALKYRMVLEGLQELSGEKVEVIHIVGGGCQNTLLNQMTANACGVPVVAGPVEATALGNILLQARALGEVDSLSDIREIVQNSESLSEFEPEDQTAWNEIYSRFLELSA
ncbi:Rhamnulokinase [Polystyrenella longa]|uniref:Rhamnulokinase n=1 Tax=Polystyrenella longa TaxID=2528007 RepID=A0A518CPE8_9PLAN|nr:rhamnulokinase [Polystyrenella longa]QDU81089.1 Rhamnulokinase [Polystyrenella longa]